VSAPDDHGKLGLDESMSTANGRRGPCPAFFSLAAGTRAPVRAE